MADYLNPKERSIAMSHVKNRDTKIEKVVRSQLHQRGFRFRKNVKKLPGKPDIVLSKYNAVLLIHGCFWHGHECNKGKLPTTKVSFWENKIASNKARDKDLYQKLLEDGWRVAIVWQCAYRNREQTTLSTDLIIKWLLSNSSYLELPEQLYSSN